KRGARLEDADDGVLVRIADQRTAPAEPAGSSDDPAQGINAAFHAEFEEALQKLFAKYDGIQEQSALTVYDGGSGAVFNQVACSASLGNGGTVRFTGTLFLHDLRWRPWPTTPVNRAGIRLQMTTHYAQGPPTEVPFEVTIVSEGFDDTLLSNAGKWKRISPEEPVFALIVAASQAESAEDIEQYKRLLLNVTYKVLSRDNPTDYQKEAITIREKAVDDRLSIKRTPLSMLILVVQKRKEMKGPKGKATTEQVHKYFESCHWSVESERPSITFLENAFALWNKIEANPSILSTIQAAEVELGHDSVFSSVYQLYFITLSCKKAPGSKLAWIFDGILDGARAGILKKPDVAKYQLTTPGKINPVEVLSYKYDLLQELLQTELTNLNIPATDAADIRLKLRCHASYREHCGFKNGEPKMWLSLLPELNAAFVNLVDAIVFDKLRDTTIRQCIKQGKLPPDGLRYGTLGTATQTLQDCQQALAVSAAAAVEDAVIIEEDAVDPPDVDGADEEMDPIDPEKAEALARWRGMARDKVRQRVELLIRPANSSADVMSKLLWQSTTYKMPIPEGLHHLHVYDSKTEGQEEAEDEDSLSITPESIYMFLDAFKHENANVFEKAFNGGNKRMPRVKKILYVSYDEATMLRRTRTRQHDIELDVMEQAHVFTAKSLTLPLRKRLSIGENGCNRFNHLGPVKLEDPTDKTVEWVLPLCEKKEILGDTLRDAGGPTPPGGDQVAGGRRDPMSEEPVSWHGASVDFWREIVHAYSAFSLTDLTPQNENCAVACIMQGCHYICLCNNDVHQSRLQERIIDRVYQLMADESSPLFESMMAAEIGEKGQSGGQGGEGKGAGGQGGKGLRKGGRGRGRGRGTGRGNGEGRGRRGRKGRARGGDQSGAGSGGSDVPVLKHPFTRSLVDPTKPWALQN
ncbi:unnamed protein product, partial [Symbiodinium sp. CCMP2456]